jgi:hypothetical protein
MSYVLTLKLSFLETVVLCKALSLYVEKQTDDLENDRDKAKSMLREVERALERGPVPRASALKTSIRPAETIACDAFLCLPEDNPSHYVDGKHLPLSKAKP